MVILGISITHWAALFTIFGVIIGMIPRVRNFLGSCWRKTFGRRGAQLDRIEAEFRPNGGDSLRDKINKMMQKQTQFEAFLNASLNIHNEAVFRTNEKGKFIFTNRAHQRLTGFSYIEVKGDGWINYIAPEDRVRVLDLWRDTVASGREMNEILSLISPSGSIYRVKINVFREIDNDGKLKGYLGVMVPIDERTGCEHKDTCLEHLQELFLQHTSQQDVLHLEEK